MKRRQKGVEDVYISKVNMLHNTQEKVAEINIYILKKKVIKTRLNVF